MKLGIYGGTFNPVHYGHLRSAQEVLELLELDKIMFVPSGKTPFDKPELASPPHRYRMVERAIRRNKHFILSDVEVKTRGTSYTINTVKKLEKRHRDDRLFFILGIDTFLDLEHWKSPAELVRLLSFVVISRPRRQFSDLEGSPFLKGVRKKALQELDSGNSQLFIHCSAGRPPVFLCRVSGLDISASGIRACISGGKSINYLLPDSVKSYIISNKLYRRKTDGKDFA